MANITPHGSPYKKKVLYSTGLLDVADNEQDSGGYDDTVSNGRQQMEEIFETLFRRKWLIALSFVVMLTVAALYTMLQKPVYEARSYIMVDLQSKQGGVSSEGQVLGDDDSFFSTNNRTLTDELFVLQNSNQLAERVANRLQELRLVPGTNDLLPILATQEGRLLTSPELVNRVPFHASFSPVRGSTNIVEVKGLSAEPNEAVLLANIYAREYVQLTEEARTARLTRSREFLQEQLAMRQNELREAEERLESYLRDQEVVSLDQDAGAKVVQLAGLQARRDDALLELEMRRGNIESLEQELATLSSQQVEVIASALKGRIDAVHGEMSDLQSRRESIERLYPTPEQRREETRLELERIERKIEELQAEATALAEKYVDTEAAGDLSGLRQQIMQERIRVRELGAQVDSYDIGISRYRNDLRQVPAQSLELARLERARSYAERMVQLVSERLLSTRLAGEAERATGYVQVIREARVGVPAGSGAGRNLLMGALLGLLVGLGLALLSDKLDSRIFNPDQLRVNGYGELGAIPDMSPLIEEHTHEANIAPHGREFSSSLVALTSPMSAAAEAYRFLRTNIQYRFSDSGAKSLLITSPNVGEGKTVTACNLAVLLARGGCRTLLIDGDLRRPRVHSLFGLDQEPGVVELLIPNGQEARPVKSGVPNLSILPAGRIHPLVEGIADGEDQVLGADELLGSGSMKAAMERLRSEFDFIIVDSPPVLAATDAALLSRLCDSTMLVTRAGSTKERELKYAGEVLSGLGASILGVLLNGFHTSMAYGYKYKYEGYSSAAAS